MSLIKLTQNLENFQWTDYSKAGTGKSPQPDGTDYFERPNPKSLDQMESKFGQLDTKPTFRGPYGVSNVMDGEKQGRGFIPPGSTPTGFTKDMDLLHNPSELAIGQNLTRTPLSYEVAGVTSNLFYGQVSKKELNIEPVAKGAYGVKDLPISTYTSVYPIADIPFGEVGGSNTFYGNLEPLSSRTSQFQTPDGSYSTPVQPHPFVGPQRTFVIPASYPENTSAFTIDSQFGWSHNNLFLETSGGPWGNIPSEWIETKTTRHETPWTQAEIDAGWLISDEVGDSRENSFKEVYTTTQTIVHPIQPLNLNSVPNYNAPSWLELQFLTNYADSNHIWPYKVLGFTGTHPLIRKDIGERYQIGDVENWMALQVVRTADDIERVEKWLDTPKGELWINTQQILQELNPREETRHWSESNLLLSVPPLFHANRHRGETYMDVADFGPIFEGDLPVEGGPTLRSTLEGKYPGLVGPLKTMDEGIGWLESGLNKISSALGVIDFNEQGAGGRLRFFRDKFIAGDSAADTSLNLGGISVGNLLNTSSPFGRTPVIPTQTTFSQRGAYGRGNANENVLKNSSETVLQRYKTLSYGQLNKGFGYDKGGPNSLISPGEIPEGILDPFDISLDKKTIRLNSKEIVDGIGNPGRNLDPDVYTTVFDNSTEGAGLGVIKKGADDTYNNELTDKINMLPYGQDYKDGEVNDFIKFKFYDIENKKHIIFRAILSGISDSITPEWSGTRYIGRPDQVYVYSGTERKISFTFEIYPKTKQEFPVLLEKMNYLVGLCYPTYTPENRMIAPFIELTLGDMFHKTPGFLDSLSVEVNDTSTWEIDDGLQFPKHITCQCSFTYVGKYLPSSLGKHYELGWLDDKGWGVDDNSQVLKGTFVGDNDYPTRIKFGGEEGKETFNMDKLFSDLGASSAE